MSDLRVPLTGLYSGILGAIFVALSARVSYYRNVAGVSTGDGTLEVSKATDEKKALEKYEPLKKSIRIHANFAEYTPLFVVLLGWIELNGYPKSGIHAFGALFLLGRLAHIQGMLGKRSLGGGRVIGIAATYLSILGLSLSNIFKSYHKGKLY